MKYLDRIRVVQFYLFEQQEIALADITGVFGPNGAGKSSLLDAVQIAMFGANSRLAALNAQADEQATTRSLRAYCLGQVGEGADNRARDNATTYITLVWRDTETGAPLSMGVCLYASADSDAHEVRGRYILPGVELSMGDHVEVVDGKEQPRDWATFRHQLIERSKVSGQDPLYADSDRYIRAALLALRGSGSAPSPEAFTRAFRFALRMRFDKTVDGIVRNDVLEARPTNIKKFREVTESFRKLAEKVAQVQAKIADGERVSQEFDKAAEESRKLATWAALSTMAEVQVAGEALEQARSAVAAAEDAVGAQEQRQLSLETEAAEARLSSQRAREQREAHASHKDYGALQTAIQAAGDRAKAKRTEVLNNVSLVRRALDNAAGSGRLTEQVTELRAAVGALDQLGKQITEGSITREAGVAVLRPALKVAQSAFNALFEQGSALKRALGAAREAEKHALDNMKRLATGRPPLLPEVTRLMAALGDQGIHATPVCDLVRVLEPEWQPVIEAYLGRNLEALLVPSANEKDAFRIYRGLTGPQAVYGAKIAMESRQPVGKRYEPGTVANLIAGDWPAGAAYLQRQFGDLRCATTDGEALAGHRTLTKDGMLVSTGEIERLRLVSAAQFKIGAGSAEQRNAVQAELDAARAQVKTLEAEEGRLSGLLDVLRRVGHEESALQYVTEAWADMAAAMHDVSSKTDQLKGAADEDYVRLGAEELTATRQAESAELQLRDVLIELGRVRTQREQCIEKAGAAQAVLDRALAASTEARQHPDVDKDLESRQWDAMLGKYEGQYAAMVRHADEQGVGCRKRMAAAITAGMRELGTFLEKNHEQAPATITSDWLAARAWMADLLKRLHETQLDEFKAEMDNAYRTSQETFRNDVAIALNNHLEWLDETMTRLNTVLRECPAFSNGERYRFRRVTKSKLESLLKFVKDVADNGPSEDLFGGPGEMPDAFRALLEDKIAPGAGGVRSPLDDYREFFDYEIEILRDDPLTGAPKVVGHLSKRLGPGSGGEHRAPLYVIAGAALASAYRLERGNKDGIRLMLLDEAFTKMDATNILATMRYLEELGLQVLMASPGENLGILTAFLHRYYDILRDIENNAVLIEGHDVSADVREQFRAEVPEFNPALVERELLAMRRRGLEAAELSEADN
jgi:chromosome segregation ATPase